MAERECYHCKQWVGEGEPHDCWTTTEAALTRDLGEDLRDAWERLRETAAEFGDQRIYASHNSIMFSRKSCYFFVRPKRKHLEVCVFLGRTVSAPPIRRVLDGSKTKRVHILHITHRDEVEPPITDWLREAYELQDLLASNPKGAASPNASPSPARGTKARPTTAPARLKSPAPRAKGPATGAGAKLDRKQAKPARAPHAAAAGRQTRPAAPRARNGRAAGSRRG
jgi:hypothetical protein